MKQTLLPIYLATLAMIFHSLISAQNLTPETIIQINNLNSEADVSLLLKDKGFEFNNTKGNSQTQEISQTWLFWSHTKRSEVVNSFLPKVTDSTRKSKTVFTLYNAYHYRDFVKNLKESNYKFAGLTVTNDKAYLCFKKKDKVFLLKECSGHADTPYYEIVQTQ